MGARRFAFNWGLALVKERLEARRRGEDVEVPWTLPALRRELKTPRLPNAVIGVDAGLRHLAVLSTGERVPNPQPLKRAFRRLTRLNRELERRKLGSRNREKMREKLARLHARVANIRRDALHKLTTRLARTYGVIVVERLHVSGLVGNRRLARAVADASLAETRLKLAYKTAWYGSRLVEADRFWPSSRICSRLRWSRFLLTRCGEDPGAYRVDFAS